MNKTRLKSKQSLPNLSRLIGPRLAKQNFQKHIHEPFWIPSVGLVGFFVILFVITLLLSHIGTDFMDFWPGHINLIAFESNKYQNLIAIDTGVGAIIVGITFFVAQGLLENTDPDRARVLLYKSSFFPLLSANILIFILLLTGALNYLILYVLGALGLFTIFSLGRTVLILIRASDLVYAKQKVFFDILKKNYLKLLILEIKKQESIKVLQKVSQHYGNVLFCFDSSPKLCPAHYRPFTSLKDGVVSDFSFKQFDLLIEILKGLPINEEVKEYQRILCFRVRPQKPLLIIHPNAFQSVSEKTVLLEVRNDLLQKMPHLFEMIYSRLNLIFIIKINRSKEEARFELYKLKDQCLAAIKNEKTGEFERSVKIFEALISALYKSMKTWVRTNNRSSWRVQPIEWLFNDLLEIVEVGLLSDNFQIIKLSTGLPVALAKQAIDYQYSAVFQEFTAFFALMNKISRKHKLNHPEHSIWIDSALESYIAMVTDLNLVVRTLEGNLLTQQDIQSLANFLLTIYQNLMMQNFNDNQQNRFVEYLNQFMSVAKTMLTSFGLIPEETPLKAQQTRLLFKSASRMVTNAEFYLTQINALLPNSLLCITKLFLESDRGLNNRILYIYLSHDRLDQENQQLLFKNPTLVMRLYPLKSQLLKEAVDLKETEFMAFLKLLPNFRKQNPITNEVKSRFIKMLVDDFNQSLSLQYLFPANSNFKEIIMERKFKIFLEKQLLFISPYWLSNYLISRQNQEFLNQIGMQLPTTLLSEFNEQLKKMTPLRHVIILSVNRPFPLPVKRTPNDQVYAFEKFRIPVYEIYVTNALHCLFVVYIKNINRPSPVVTITPLVGTSIVIEIEMPIYTVKATGFKVEELIKQEF